MHIEATHVERITRGFAGTMVLLTLLLAYFHSPYWLWLTTFVGANMLQSAFTDTCPLMVVLRKLSAK